jgi:hypothetical protein
MSEGCQHLTMNVLVCGSVFGAQYDLQYSVCLELLVTILLNIHSKRLNISAKHRIKLHKGLANSNLRNYQGKK